MLDTGYGIRDAGAVSFRTYMLFFNRLDEPVQFSSEPIHQVYQSAKQNLVLQGLTVPQSLDVINRFIARRMRINQIPDVFLFISPQSEAFYNV